MAAPRSLMVTGRHAPWERPLRLQDMDLVQRIRRGDGAAFDELVAAHGNELFGLAFTLVGNRADAEDVLQQTFIGAYQRIAAFEGRSALKTWLVRILVNQASKCRRSRRVRRSVAIDAQEGSAGGAELGPALCTQPAAAAVDSQADLATMLQCLSDEHRQVLVLREVNGLSYDEIAETLGLPRGTVESRLFRARQELRRRYSDYFS